ncbi:hypothetical protein OB2597_11401 [Pseudooceanicola batsensis HTCC2597]|uniref:Endonuclease/exonuclease/phosphatase domain-containing protein n=1 Tax=Pseudooceanicola batsensis (strain ATCC BAA-863 / DSM 15984 / KCTC 12145 / HTCC2597) TaxID=252305 RepID=A3TW50_PSEBH|nr:endonuclease/exonuclease/phosphatase family protein [Pseudooceanicola batsensis]EAQ03846.1 hypothetical protein OB2597_11401 [Pseudooceanicola batsensis HTCC2597]
MRIVSLNAWGGRLFEEMVAWIAEVQPDILCLQETVFAPGSPSAWLDYRDGDTVLPQRADVLRDVSRALPDHGMSFCPAACGNLWLGNREVPSLWGLATFLHPDLMIVGQSQGFVHGAFSPDGFGDHPRSRTAHVVRVWHPDEGGITVGHMHGLRDPNGKMDTPVRGEQARKFATMVQSVLQPGDPVVACGDFNVLPGSETFRVMARVAPYNLVTQRGFDGTRTSHYEKPERWADYMLVNGPLKDAAFDVIRTPEISDHCPLVLDTV